MASGTIRGIGASPGIAIGPVFHYEVHKPVVESDKIKDPQAEHERLDIALEQARREVRALFNQAQHRIGTGNASIFEAHELMLGDPELLQLVYGLIEKQHFNAAYAWQEGTGRYVAQLRAIGDEYLAARAIDLEDVARRVLLILLGTAEQAPRMTEPAIIVATDLTPSETVLFEREYVQAFCTGVGGPTSHVAILAKALGIPAITGLGSEVDWLTNGTQVIADGTTGELIIEPDSKMLAAYQVQEQEQTQLRQAAFSTASQPAITRDGVVVEVVANIGAPEQATEALFYGAEGIGLLRTEFLFMEREVAPTEDEQFAIYQTIFEKMEQRPVVVRTFDIGGDKPAAYLTVPEEMNPFLGVRGIRLAFEEPELFQTQLRALLRAGYGHRLKIMFPMITTVAEIDLACGYVFNVQMALKAEGQPCAEDYELGIMVEVPSAALMADILAQKVDFFSIGTNDLSQYTLAADRTNSTVAALADALHPAVLRLIRQVVEAAHAQKKWVGVCGELAGDSLAAPILLGLGVDEVSMTPRAIPLMKETLRRYNLAEAREIAQQALNMSSAVEVRNYLRSLSEGR